MIPRASGLLCSTRCGVSCRGFKKRILSDVLSCKSDGMFQESYVVMILG